MLITCKADIRAPSAPVLGTPTATGSTTISIPLTTAATDTGSFGAGVASYALERAMSASGPFSVLSSAASFPYSDSGLTASTTYYYRAAATDNSGNVGSYSAIVSQTTQAGSSTGASITNGILTVTGTGFGTKSTAAPEYFNNFSANTNGDNYAAAGFDFRSDATGFIDASVQSGVHAALATGHKYYRNHWSGGNYQTGVSTDPFHQSGIYMPGTLKCHTSYWMKIVRVSGPAYDGTEGQWKGPRWGHNYGAFTSSTSGGDLYNSTNAKMWSEHFDDTTPGDNSGSDNVRYRSIAGTEGDQYAPLNLPHVALDDEQWHLIDDFGSMNDVGVANGVRQHFIDGILRLNRSDQQPRSQAGQSVGFCIPNPGITNSYTQPDGNLRVVDGLMSNILIDSCWASVFLINQATLTGAKRYYLPPITWSNTQVTATCDPAMVPTGYNWAVVLNENLTAQVFAL